jgi:hypothetical protein
MVSMSPSLPSLSPRRKRRKKFVDKLFKTGSVSHALPGMNRVPYSQLLRSVGRTKLGNTPYRLTLPFKADK